MASQDAVRAKRHYTERSVLVAGNPLISSAELSKRLGVGRTSVDRMAAKGLIPSNPWGPKLGARRFDEQEVRAALAKLTKPLRPYHPPKEKDAVQTAGVQFVD